MALLHFLCLFAPPPPHPFASILPEVLGGLHFFKVGMIIDRMYCISQQIDGHLWFRALPVTRTRRKLARVIGCGNRFVGALLMQDPCVRSHAKTARIHLGILYELHADVAGHLRVSIDVDSTAIRRVYIA